eukprot:1156632-Pelagomonas_calceolata.AAC.2
MALFRGRHFGSTSIISACPHLFFQCAHDKCVLKGRTSYAMCSARVLSFSSFFSLYVNNVDSIAEDVRGAATGTENVCRPHMLYADDS